MLIFLYETLTLTDTQFRVSGCHYSFLICHSFCTGVVEKHPPKMFLYFDFWGTFMRKWWLCPSLVNLLAFYISGSTVHYFMDSYACLRKLNSHQGIAVYFITQYLLTCFLSSSPQIFQYMTTAWLKLIKKKLNWNSAFSSKCQKEMKNTNDEESKSIITLLSTLQDIFSLYRDFNVSGMNLRSHSARQHPKKNDDT